MRFLTPGRADFAELVRLAVPVVVVQVGMVLMGVVDTIMVGRVSPTDLAAVALGTLYFSSAIVFGLGTLLALDPVVSQSVGAGDREGIARGVQRGAVLALALSLVAALLLLPVEPVLEFLRQPEDVIPVASGYVRASLPGILPFYLFVVFRQTLQAKGVVAPVVVVVLAANIANVVFNWMLVFGNLGAPALGAVGSGWASSLSRWIMVASLLMVAWPVLRPYVRPFRRVVLQPRPLGRMVRLGAPIGVQLFLEFGAFGVIGILMGWLGTIAMAGHQVALNLASLTFMVPLGVAQATTVLVGQAIGREDQVAARRSAGAGLLTGMTFMVGTAILFITLPSLLAHAYTSEETVLTIATALIPVAGVFQVFDGIQVVASGVLRGVGDTWAPMTMNILGFWLIGLPISLWVGFRMGGGPTGLWWGLVAGLAAVSILLLVRVRHRLGGELTRLRIDD